MSSHQSRPRRSWKPRLAAIGTAVSLALLGARAAHADCAVPAPSIEFTYPDETTESVPPDAVFWVVSPAGETTAWIDNVRLTPVGTSDIERHQFVYPVPLTEGEHQLLARAGNSEPRTVTFRVSDRPPSSGDASIDAVATYPFMRGHDEWLYPPGFDNECGLLSVPLGVYCDDVIPEALSRVSYRSEGDVIAYLVQGELLLPPACSSLWMSAGSTYSVAAILPTGVAEAHTYGGTVEVHTREDTYPQFYEQADQRCSIGFGQRAPSTLAGAALVLVAWLARRRRCLI